MRTAGGSVSVLDKILCIYCETALSERLCPVSGAHVVACQEVGSSTERQHEPIEGHPRHSGEQDDDRQEDRVRKLCALELPCDLHERNVKVTKSLGRASC